MKRNYLLGSLVLSLLLTGCKVNKPGAIIFTYKEDPYTPLIGTKENTEVFNYNEIVVNKVENLREDFAMGVDASMVKTVEENGGVYYNEEGKEQDVFQIMNQNGVNFFRVRIWNNPENLFGDKYGGGNVDTAEAISMAKRAQAANMNVMVDLHYSDFWADPSNQRTPTKWVSKDLAGLALEVEKFTKETVQAFKDEGVEVQAIQIGNEINNGLLHPLGRLDWENAKASYENIALLLKAGIKGAKAAAKDIKTMIHLADGGSFDVFNAFFSAMETNKVNYDLIGASYYPYYHGSLENLKHNLDNTASKFKKPVIVAEMSYGYTVADTPNASHIYNTQMEDMGKYLTSIQGQATAIHDVVKILSEVPEKRGLGIFYWEPAWLPVPNASWATAEGQAWVTYGDANDLNNVNEFSDGKATWANQALFSYNGRMLPSLKTFKMLRTDHNKTGEVATKVRTSSIDVTLNIATKEKLPATYLVETSLDAIRPYDVVWDESDVSRLVTPGNYIVKGTVLNRFTVTANVKVIENFISDPSFEEQGSSDRIIAPWTANSTTHAADVNKVVKLNRKAGDVLDGTTSLNWYHSNQTFDFKVSQKIMLEEAGTYTFSAFVMAINRTEIKHTELQIFIVTADNTKHIFDYKDLVRGWGTLKDYYIKGTIEFSLTKGQEITLGLEGRAPAQAWGHADAFSLVKGA